MDYKDLEQLLQLLKDIPDSTKRDECIRLILKTGKEEVKQDKKGLLLKLTDKEISKIPMRFRKDFLINDRLVRCRRRLSGKKTINYEIRYRKHGFNIAVSSNDIISTITESAKLQN